MRHLLLALVLPALFGSSPLYAQDFYLDSNGITIRCENASVGDTWTSFGVEYLAVDNQSIRSVLESGRDMGTICTSHVTSLNELFGFRGNFNDDISSWDVSNVTGFMRVFVGAESFNRDIGEWDVSSGTTMELMFEMARNFNQDISGWDISNVKNMSGMFGGANSFNQDISGWDVSSVENAASMFSYATSFNQDISGWNVSNVQNFSGMFQRAEQFDQPIGIWDVSAAVSMKEMFAGAWSFNTDLTSWDISNVTDLSRMFLDTHVFDRDISTWDTRNVQNMSEMFYLARAFNQDISSWEVRNVINMSSMFRQASVFNQDLSKWCVPQIASIPSMFASRSPIDSRSDLHPQWGCPVPPDADARSSVTSGIAPLDVVFTAAFSSDLNGDALTYEWNLGDGTNSSETVVNKTYPAGDYTVSLVVSDGELLDTSYVSIQSINVAPAVSVTTSDLEGLSPLTVSFDASGTTDQNGDALTFLWDFANGDTSPEPIVERVFKAGQYEVLLTVSDGIVTDSTWFSILSVNEAPQVALQTSATSGQAPFEITFDASGTRDANSDSLSFAWDLGDGSTSSDTIVVHTYTAAGDYNVVLTVSDGIESVSDSLTVSIASGVATEAAELPESYELRAAYPNPFNPTTTISYALPAPSEVRISVVDMLGRQVATLVSGDMKAAGYHTVQFNADGLASGTYLIRMEAGDFVATQQVVLLK